MRTTRVRPSSGLYWIVGPAGLLAPLLTLAFAPLILDDTYSILNHTTSESAGQGVDGAWLARTGFLLFGLSVLWIAARAGERWGQPARAFHAAFAICMFAVAAFSLRSWMEGMYFDPTEDLLHSVGATVMGFAFAFGVAAVAVKIHAMPGHWRVLDAVAVTASVVLPISMGVFGNVDGVLQRVMFLVAYIWYFRESLIADSPPWGRDRS